jgi:hypothetical protein
MDTSAWMMAEQAGVDAYVCGYSETLPILRPFQPPAQSDLIAFRPVIGQTGNFEFFRLYWVNRWIVYVPR